MSDILLNGARCPSCAALEVWFSWGEPEEYDRPGTAVAVYCAECGWEHDIDLADSDRHPVLDGWSLTPRDMAHSVGCDIGQVARLIFKYADSGVSFDHDEHGVVLTPYAEGFDGEIPAIRINYPFRMQDFWDIVELCDRIGAAVWACANTHDEDCMCYVDALVDMRA